MLISRNFCNKMDAIFLHEKTKTMLHSVKQREIHYHIFFFCQIDLELSSLVKSYFHGNFAKKGDRWIVKFCKFHTVFSHLTKEKFREINDLVTPLVKMLLSRNLRNSYTVSHCTVEIVEIMEILSHIF